MVSGPIRFASLLSAAFVIVAVAPPAARAADLYCEPIQIKCGGFEPNWSFELTTDNALKFTDPENPNWETKPVTVDACARRAGNGYTIEAGSLLDMSAQVKRERCVEPNDQVRDYSLSIRFNQGAETSSPRAVSGTGCCWR
jgi:hypothetical protein